MQSFALADILGFMGKAKKPRLTESAAIAASAALGNPAGMQAASQLLTMSNGIPLPTGVYTGPTAGELARHFTAMAIQALVAALDDPRLRVQAAAALLDRGWGRPLHTAPESPAGGISITINWAGPAAGQPITIDAVPNRMSQEGLPP